MAAETAKANVLLTGATGFVGGELLPRLRDSHVVRCLVRDADAFTSGGTGAGPDVVEADLADAGSLEPALEGIEHVFYLVHSMEPGAGGFADRDREAAENYAAAAANAGVKRTVYLGGISPDGGGSEHLDSRLEVEDVLREATSEFVALRASMIVGAGSGSFRTLVQLVDRLPVLALPSWRDRRTQPVGIDDVITCLLACVDVRPGVYEIAGCDVLTFGEMTEVVSDLLGQTHRAIRIPFSDSRVEAVLSAAVTDQDRELLEPLMAGLDMDLLVEDNDVSRVFGVEPAGFRDAAELAIERLRELES